jgi:radical SAM protein with 4Fe4S-binding SPASM domain
MQDQFMMDNHKLLWHLDRVNQWQRGERIAPLHVDFGITTGCNIACIYCYGMLQGRTAAAKRFDLPRDTLLRFIRDANEIGVRSVAFIGEGENTLNPNLTEGLSLARRVGLDASIATNGVSLDRESLKEMLQALVWMRFNISAADSESYRRIHGVNKFEAVVNNIRTAVELKKQLGLSTTIGMQMIVVRDNISEVVPLTKLGKSLGLDYFVVKPCSDDPEKSLDAPTSEYFEMEGTLKRAEALSSSGYDVVIKWQKFGNAGLKDFETCYGTQFIINVSGDGSVFPCGHFFNNRRSEFLMGNITETPFSEIVQSDRYWEVQKKIEKVDVNHNCETNCRQYYVSRFLWSLKNQPPHVNFI